METKPVDELKKGYRVAIIIGIAMIGSLFIYAAIVEFIKINYKSFKGFSPFPEVEILRYIFFGITIAEFFLIGFIKKFILSREVTDENNPNQRAFSPRIQRLLTTAIVTYAICESIALYGFVLFLIGGSSFDFYIFMVISFIFYVGYFPRYLQWEEYLSS